MRLSNEFFVPASPNDAWDVLLDVDRIAGCMPGASLERLDDERLTGAMDVKVGPISMTYEGDARYVERDRDARRVVLRAEGSETRGSGTAGASVTAQLHEENGGTRVTVDTDLEVTGRPAQFGRGVLADVSQQIINDFAERLSEELKGSPGPASEKNTEGGDNAEPSADARGRRPGQPGRGPAGNRRVPDRDEPEQLDMWTVMAGPLLKRSRLVLAAVALFLVGWAVGRTTTTAAAKPKGVTREFGYRRYSG